MPPTVEWQMWRQLRGPLRISKLLFTPIMEEVPWTEQYNTIEECIAVATGELVFLEPNGKRAVTEIPDGDIILVIGNSAEGNMKLAEPDQTYKIKSERGHLYGTNAAAIALAIRYGQ